MAIIPREIFALLSCIILNRQTKKCKTMSTQYLNGMIDDIHETTAPSFASKVEKKKKI